MNRQQILSRLANDTAGIVYTTGAWSIWDRHDDTWRHASMAGSLKPKDGVLLDHPPKWLLRCPAHSVPDRVALELASRRYARLMRKTFGRPFVLLVYHPRFAAYARRLKPALLVYYAYDLYERAPGWTEQAAADELWLLRNADLRIASSDPIAARLTERSDMPVRTLPNGADVQAFRQALQAKVVPDDLARLSPPRIGYIGSLNRKVDFSLIANLAKRRPDWNFVLLGAVGSLDEVACDGLNACRRQANVHELGPRPRNEIPPYVANLDVALMPYRLGADLWSDSGYPLKLHEYLAAERPIVTSRLPSLEPFAHVLDFAGAAGEWEAGIDAALAAGDADARVRRQTAQAYDWSRLASQLQAWIHEALNDARPGN